MKARLLTNKHYPAARVFTFKPIKLGSIVPVSPANNLPYDDCYWIDTPELIDDPYGILLHTGEYELL